MQVVTRRAFLAFVLWLLPLATGVCQDAAVTAIAALTDPAKLATLSGERVANPRLLKCVYWLYVASERGHAPDSAIDVAQTITHSTGARAALVKDELLRNLDIAEKLGCLTDDNLRKLRHGHSPTVTLGPYAGEPAEVDHIIPIALAPELGKEFANLELLPRTVNRKKSAKMGQRQRDYALKFKDAGMISVDRFLSLSSEH